MIAAPTSASVSDAVQELVGRFTALWWQHEGGLPALGRAFTAPEQSAREGHLESFAAALQAETKRPPRSDVERSSARERIFGAFGAFARAGLDWEDRHLDVLFSHGLDQVVIDFVGMTRRFDALAGAEDTFQAIRNALVMNGLQLLLGLPVQLTPAVFAYSMLYPYSDNYLDDATVSADTKLAFNERFGRRLEGRDVAPANAHERAIFDLVAMIEGQFERSRYPQVFESLLAIHRAQVKSMRLLRRGASPYDVDVLGISLEKGGASVLADGYLIAGALTPAQAAFMFGFGAFLQLGDDLQDVGQDTESGQLTLFSQTAGRWPLDALTNRTLAFGARVLEGMDAFDAPGCEPLKELIRYSAVQLVIGAAGSAKRFYSRSYLEQIETHSPFRFASEGRQMQKLTRQRAGLTRLYEAFAGGIE